MVRRNMPPRPPHPQEDQSESHLAGLKDLSLLDHQSEEVPVARCPTDPVTPGGFPDRIYAHAAAIFQKAHTERPVTQRLVNYGKETDQHLPEAKDAISKRWAHELTFNTLKYQDLLEDIMIDSSFYLSRLLPDDLMSLAVVMLYDFMDRKFLPREQPDSEEEERLAEVREVESYLLRFKTKLAASLARCRIKRDVLSIDYVLPACVRERRDRACSLPVYAWINTLKASLEDVCSTLKRVGFSQVNSIRQLEGLTFCRDPHGHDLLAFPPHVKADLQRTRLLSERKLVIQDKTCCLAPSSVRPLLAKGGDVLMAGSFSALTVAHMAALAAPASGQVLVCGDSWAPSYREILDNMECKNVTLMEEGFLQIDGWDPQVQGVWFVLLMPPCSASAISNPVEFILAENGNADMLQDLAKGSIAAAKMDTLVTRQTRDLKHALKFSKVRAVVYCTCSIHREENEEVVAKALEQAVDCSKQPLFRVTAPALAPSSVPKDGDAEGNFFRMDPSEDSNGCFLATLTREDQETETVQDILARAAATGLLDGIGPKEPRKKEKRRRTRRAAAPRPAARRPRVPGDRLLTRIDEFLAREAEGVPSQPTVVPQTSGGGDSRHKGASKGSHKRPLPKSNTGSSGSSPTQKSTSRVTSSTRRPTLQRPPSYLSTKGSPAGPSPPLAPPPAPPTSRQEALRPVEMVLPPVAFPSFTSMSSGRSSKPGPALSSHSIHATSKTSLPLSASSGVSRDRGSAVWHPRPWH